MSDSIFFISYLPPEVRDTVLKFFAYQININTIEHQVNLCNIDSFELRKRFGDYLLGVNMVMITLKVLK